MNKVQKNCISLQSEVIYNIVNVFNVMNKQFVSFFFEQKQLISSLKKA